MTLVLSTSWNASKYSHAKEIIEEIKKLGFKKIELNFSLTEKIVQEFISLVKNKQICVTSVHNFCPIPFGLDPRLALPDYYSLASMNESERSEAIRQTYLSIKTAKKLNAQALVLHSGRVEIRDQTRALINLYEKGLKNTKKFKVIQNAFIKERKEKSKRHLGKILKSLDALNKYAKKENIKLGIETRFYFREIPNFEEIGIILDKFKNSNIFYWHDVGHAQIMDNLGFAKHKDFLNCYGNRMLGIHIHDVIGCDDHHAPFTGDFNFKFLKPYLRKNTLKVIEAHHPATGEELKKARVSLEKIYQ